MRCDDMPVSVEFNVDQWQSTGNATPLLHEIRHALELLLESGKETVIDLQSIPMAPADEVQLLDALGTGEIEAQLTALGQSIIRETAISGVWFVEHFNTEEQPIGRYIEVTFVPSILKSQREDVRKGMERLAYRLSAKD